MIKSGSSPAPYQSDDCAHVVLQWEAIGADGELFTALLADLMLVPAGDQITALSLAGAYWPPPGRAGAALGQVIARCCATVVIGSFLDSVACQLGHPAGTAETEGCSPCPLTTGASHKSEFRSGHSNISAANDIPGAKMGANSARRQATSGHNEPAPSQVNGMLGYAQQRLATAKA